MIYPGSEGMDGNRIILPPTANSSVDCDLFLKSYELTYVFLFIKHI